MGAGDFDPEVIGNNVSETHCIKILSLTRIFILFHELKKQITSQEFNHRYHRLTMEWDGVKGVVLSHKRERSYLRWIACLIKFLGTKRPASLFSF